MQPKQAKKSEICAIAACSSNAQISSSPHTGFPLILL